LANKVPVAFHFITMAKQMKVETFPPEDKAAMVLAEDGKPGATIVIKKDATDLQQDPAKDLQEYICKITGVVLPIADDDKRIEGNLILVGKSRLTREMGINPSELTGDSFMIKAVPGRLVLVGNDDALGGSNAYNLTKKGTTNAVNAFLQDYCGVRWFMPGELGEVVPHKKALAIPEINKQERLFRLYSCGDFSGSPWSRRNFFGTSVFLYHPGGHLWPTLIPTVKYFKDHPEWFALLGGERTGEGNYLCLTNKEMWAEALKNLKALYAEGYEMVELGQTDGYQRCRCEKCEAMDEYRDDAGYYVPGKPADRIWVFHDFLAREIQKTYPDRKIIILSYGPTDEPPHGIKGLPDNTIAELCNTTPEAVERWRKFHNQFAVYIYWFDGEIKNYLPVSFFYVSSEFKRLASAGAKGYFFCGGGSCWNINAPIYYLIGQLLRDPKRNEEEVLHEFCAGLFEEASFPMKNFFKTFYQGAGRAEKMTYTPEVMGEPYKSKKVSIQELYLGCFTDDILNSCEKSLKQAESLANNEIVLRRIQFFRDGFDYVKLTTYGFAR